jgi:glucose/arabinose dehydrogenase
VGLAQFPGDPEHAVVLTQFAGVIYQVSLADDGEPTVFLDLSDEIIDNPGNEEGLLGFAFSPDYQQDRRFWVYYSAGNPRRNVLAQYRDASDGRRILEVMDPFPNHNGGAIEFGPDGYLYVAIGDGGSAGDPQQNGQNTDVLLGKILRLDVSGETYAIPPDNPFASGGGRGEIWAYGLRNPWRMTFDRETGDLWAGDVGQNAWEEIDRIERGGNYGWSIMEGPDCFREDGCDQTGLTPPRAAYRLHEGGTCAVTGGYVYRDAAIGSTTPLPELVGWYVYADYCSGQVWAFDTTDPGSQPVELVDTDLNIASFTLEEDGSLLLITFQGIFELTRN